MQHISSTEFKGQLETYLAQSGIEPISIEDAGKPVAVVVSPSEFKFLERIEDLYWISIAEAAEQAGAWAILN